VDAGRRRTPIVVDAGALAEVAFARRSVHGATLGFPILILVLRTGGITEPLIVCNLSQGNR
jgi:hypothetical protein